MFVLVAILVFVPVIMSLVVVGLFVVSVVGSALICGGGRKEMERNQWLE